MSTQAATAVSRETVAAITLGDAVEFGDEHYEWASPLDVVDATEPVEWDVRFGENWWTRTIIVEGSQGGQYGVRYDSGGDTNTPCVESYTVEDGELADKRGAVVHLVRVDVSAEDDGEDIPDADEVRPAGLTEACVHSVADHYETIDEVADDFGVDADRAETILEAHGCLDEVIFDA